MSFGEENWRVLARRIPPAEAVRLRTARPSPSLEIVPTPSGRPAAVLDGKTLCSRHDPAAEAARRAAREIGPADSAAVLLGFGLGYEAEAVLAAAPGLPLLVVEADEGLFAAALEARDLSGLLSSDRVSFLVGRDPRALTPVLDGLPTKAARILRLRHTADHDAPFYGAAEGAVRSHALRREINENTLARFGRLWVRNLSRNMPYFVSCPGVGRLEGLFEGIPSLLLAGGPSFDAVRRRLADLRERMLLVAVDTPLRACLEEGTDPDFTVVVDPQYWTTRYLDWAEGSRSLIVAEPSAHPRVLRAGRGRAFLVSSLFPLGEWLEERLGAKGKLGAGGSVSTTAWDLCRMMGAVPIHAAGLDLGFPENRTHFRGAFFEQGWFASAARLRPVETESHGAVREAGSFRHPAYGGGTTRTDKRMAVYRNWFESQLAARPGLACFNLSARATVIPGMPYRDASELLDLPCRRREIEDRMERARAMAREAGAAEPLPAALGEALDGLAGELRRLERLAAEGADLTAALTRGTGGAAEDARALRRLDAIDAGILGVSSRHVASFLLQAVIREIQDGGAAMGRREALGAGAKLYESLRGSARFHREVLEAARRGIGAENR